MQNFSSLLLLLIAISMSAISSSSHAGKRTTAPDTEITIEANDGTEIIAAHYPAKGDTVLIWVGSSYSTSKRIYQTAHDLADRGYEIWQVDFSEVLFQPRTSNFMRNLEAQYLTDLIVAAHERTKKKVVLITRAYGALPVVRGATLWQQQNIGKNYLSGAILFSPDFFASIPELGQDPIYLPITRQSTIPLFIYQGGRRGTAWQFPRLLENLTTSNQHVYFRLLPDVAGIFYRNDNDPASTNMLSNLSSELPGVIRLLHETTGEQQPAAYKQDATVHNARMDIELKPFKGKTTPTPFTLEDANGHPISLYKHGQPDELKGKITVVNFWATWCPPCVEEIPSLNRLKEIMQGKPFRLISINYAESKTLINDFLKRVNVEFPVLLDKKGKVSAEWNVVAFPSTFVIGPNGKIHYGINAAITWDDPVVIKKLNSLINNKTKYLSACCRPVMQYARLLYIQ